MAVFAFRSCTIAGDHAHAWLPDLILNRRAIGTSLRTSQRDLHIRSTEIPLWNTFAVTGATECRTRDGPICLAF